MRGFNRAPVLPRGCSSLCQTIPVLECLVCAGTVSPHCRGECFQWETLQSHGETPGCKRQGLAGKRLVRWSPVIPAVHQGCRSSELQAALHFALPMSRSFYVSISFGRGQGQKVSGVPRSVGGMGRSPGSWRAALCRERGGGRLCSCHISLGRARGRGAGSQGVQADGAAGLTLGCSQTGQAAGKGKQEKGPFLAPKPVIFNYNPTTFSTQKSEARTSLKKPCILTVFQMLEY